MVLHEGSLMSIIKPNQKMVFLSAPPWRKRGGSMRLPTILPQRSR